MIALPFGQTKRLIDLVLSHSKEAARNDLAIELQLIDSNEGQFYAGIVTHGLGLRLTTDQWFELLSRLPNRVLRSELDLEGILSEEQLRRLPPVMG